MKYYAVTDDIHELYHYGVKGMKWGQHLFGEDKSPGYRRAASKLRGFLKSVRNDVETRSDYKYQKQLDKALKRTKLSQEKYKWDQVSDRYKARDRAYEAARRKVALEEKAKRQFINDANRAEINRQKYEMQLSKSQAKQAKLAAKAEKRFDKYLQEAREGRLRANKLSDEQIQRINDRLIAEQKARQLGGSEKASYRVRRREAIREGKIEGYKRGTAAGMEALAKGLVEMGIANRLVKASNNRSEARRQKAKNRIVNKKSWIERRSDARRDIQDEAYKEKLMSPEYYNNHVIRISPTKKAAEALAIANRKKEQSKANEQLYKNWLQPKKNENAEQYTKRINDHAEEMRSTIMGLSYQDPNKPKYHRRTIHDTANDMRTGARHIIQRGKKISKAAKQFLSDYPSYDADKGSTGISIDVKSSMPIASPAPLMAKSSKKVYKYKSSSDFGSTSDVYRQMMSKPKLTAIEKSINRHYKKRGKRS